MKKIIYLIVGLLIFNIAIVFAGEYRYIDTTITRTGSPRIESINFHAILTKDTCVDWLYGEYTYTGEETKDRWTYTWNNKVDSWNVKISEKAYCEIAESNGNYVKWRCKLIYEEYCINPHFGSYIPRLQLYATIHPPGKCIDKSISHPEGTLWCDENILKKCVNEEITIIKTCGVEETCYRGECKKGCLIPQYPKVYPVGDKRCVDEKNLYECRADKTWKKVEECVLGCTKSSSKCTFGSNRCNLVTKTSPSSVKIQSLAEGTKHCLDGVIWSGRSIPDFVPGIYACKESIWNLMAECDTVCESETKCKPIAVEETPEVVELPKEFPETEEDVEILEEVTGEKVNWLVKLWNWFVGLFSV